MPSDRQTAKRAGSVAVEHDGHPKLTVKQREMMDAVTKAGFAVCLSVMMGWSSNRAWYVEGAGYFAEATGDALRRKRLLLLEADLCARRIINPDVRGVWGSRYNPGTYMQRA